MSAINFADRYSQLLHDISQDISLACKRLAENHPDNPMAELWGEQAEDWYDKKFSIWKMSFATEKEAQKKVKKWHRKFREIKDWESSLKPSQFRYDTQDFNGHHHSFPIGWSELVQQLWEDIRKVCEKNNSTVPVVSDVKEKFGGLCFYLQHGLFDNESTANEVMDLIRVAESKSYSVCQITGKRGYLYVKQGLFATLSYKKAKELGFTKTTSNSEDESIKEIARVLANDVLGDLEAHLNVPINNIQEPMNYAYGWHNELLHDAASDVSKAYWDLFLAYPNHPQAKGWERQSDEWRGKDFSAMFLATEEEAEQTVTEWFAKYSELKALKVSLDEQAKNKK